MLSTETPVSAVLAGRASSVEPRGATVARAEPGAFADPVVGPADAPCGPAAAASCSETDCCGRAAAAGVCARWLMSGAKDAAVAVSISRAATSCRAMNWLGPAAGTFAGMPTPRRAFASSTRTQAVNCAQASQTTTASALTRVCESKGRRSESEVGIWCGSGQPMKCTSAKGIPPSSTASSSSAPRARRTSPPVRRYLAARPDGSLTGCGGVYVMRSLPSWASRPPVRRPYRSRSP